MLSTFKNVPHGQVILMNLDNQRPEPKSLIQHQDVDQKQMVQDFTKFGNALEKEWFKQYDEYAPGTKALDEGAGLLKKVIDMQTRAFENVS